LLREAAFGKMVHRIKQELSMQITRTNHLRYMTRLTPMLLLLYITQALIYRQFAPAPLASEVNLFLGVGLVILILSYQFYDHHHKIHFHQNYLEVRFDILKMKEEILYQNITRVELKKSRHHFGKLILYLKDGGQCHLHHLDSPETISEFLEVKRVRRI
jgi:hypothetical protein